MQQLFVSSTKLRCREGGTSYAERKITFRILLFTIINTMNCKLGLAMYLARANHSDMLQQAFLAAYCGTLCKYEKREQKMISKNGANFVTRTRNATYQRLLTEG